MLLIDAIETIETVGGIWLGMSAIAFILMAAFVETYQESADAVESTAGRDLLKDNRQPSPGAFLPAGASLVSNRQPDQFSMAKRKAISNKASTSPAKAA